MLAVNRLAMSINVERKRHLRFCAGGLPQGGRPAGESIGERFDPTCHGYLGKKPFHMAIPIRSQTPRKRGQGIAGVTA